MADTDISLSVDLDVQDAEKTAKNLQKEVENIFNTRKGEQSATLTNLEIQMKKNYDAAEALRNKMLELSKDVPTAEYSKVLEDIEQVEQRIEIIGDQLYKQTRIPGFEEKVEALEYVNRLLNNYHAGSSGFYDARGELGEARFWTGEELQTYKLGLEGVVGDYKVLISEQDKLFDSLDSLNAKRAELEASHLDIIIGKETQAYATTQAALDNTNDKLKQEIIHYNEIEQKEQISADKAKEKLAIEQQLKQEAAERHRIQMEIAQKNWETAVAEEERQAALQQQRQLELQEQQEIKAQADLARQAQQEARMETIAANTSLMSMNMAIRSIGRIIPGVSTTSISGVVMLTRAVLRLTKLTKADLVMAIGKVKEAFAKLFSFIISHPIVLVIGALIALLVVLIKKLKGLWDDAKEAADELIEALGKGFKKLKEVSVEFVGILVKGFIKLGDLLPSTILKVIQGIINKLKSLKSVIKENLDLMAKWNEGNNEVNTALSNITSSLNYLKATLATAIAPLLVKIEPIVTHIIDIIADAVTLIGMLIAKITGATTFTRAERVQTNYAESLDKTAKSAKNANKQLAGFDKLNVLNTSSSSSSTTATGVDFKTINLIDEELPDWITNFGLLGEKVSGLVNTFLGGIPWNDIKTKVSGLSGELANFFNNLNIGASLGTTIGEGFNTIILAVNTFLDELNSIHLGEEIGNILENAVTTINWNNVGEMFASSLNNFGEFIIGLSNRIEGKNLGLAFSEFLSGSLGQIDWGIMTDAISGLVSDLVDALNVMITPENMKLVGSTLSKVFNTLICGIQLFTESAEWKEWGTNIGAGIAEFFRDIDWKSAAIVVGNFALGLIHLIGAAIGELLKPENLDVIINDIITFFENVPWDEIRQGAKEISQKLRDGLSRIWEALRDSGAYDDIIGFIVDFLNEKKNWEKLFEDFKDDVVGDIFWENIKGIFSSIISHVAYATRIIVDTITNALSWVANIFSGASVETLVTNPSALADALQGGPKIVVPKLASGAVLPPNKPFLAMVGDQKSGTNIEAPLSTIEQAVANVLSNMQIKNVFEVNGDPNRIFKVVQQESNIYYNQHGNSGFKQ